MAKVLQLLPIKRALSTKISISSRKMMSLQTDAKQIFWRAVSAVLPPSMLGRNLAVKDNGGSSVLQCGDKEFPLHKNLYLVGFGKAVLGMAAAVERIVGNHLLHGIISIPKGMEETLKQAGKREMLLSPDSRISVLEGAEQNMPDKAALKAAGQIQSLAEKLTEKDVLLVLISGGGSALLPAPVPPLTLQDKQIVTKQLAMKGATIHELNTLRRALSQLKGGGLANIAYPAQVLSLILSDVIGDDLDIIASGPTVPCTHNKQDCLHILSKYNLRESVPGAVELALLNLPQVQLNKDFSHVYNILIGSNLIALQEAKEKSTELGYHTLLMSTSFNGDVRKVGYFFGCLAQVICSILTHNPEEALQEQELLALANDLSITDLYIADNLQSLRESGNVQSVCILCGGETTVLVQGKGKGGRNQELTLRVAQEWHKSPFRLNGCDVLFLSGGTDGQDGPTEAAGAYAYPALVRHAQQSGLDAECFLTRSDSHTFFSQFQDGKYLLNTGLTGTNVMDVQVLLIRRATDRQ
ncbi:glycerate kinase [Xenopus laevis]|uniref:Glycerate kinase n=2 Tax=Xenopus laevis TaxID=8355 RepID=A0A1L8GPB1_XENLA|nr:glycerate kinase [Xenopus laevis]XP_018114484.1 glycerate kinase [Xenopus laevis]XP_018114485.1 glycerate kinase [Xenopus laevis]XP_041446719.1 glycerate kinase [Xenopus laevis]OCT85697.1 hypothetical protein XELAEV_18023868mg [Xenopus laevis]